MTNHTPPCFGLHELFDSVDYQDHLTAREYCDSCPLIAQCAAELTDVIRLSTSGGRPEGTWAGKFLADNQIRDRRTPRRIQLDEERYADEQAKAAYAAFRSGRTDDWSKTGARVHQARQKRAERAAKKVA